MGLLAFAMGVVKALANGKRVETVMRVVEDCNSGMLVAVLADAYCNNRSQPFQIDFPTMFADFVQKMGLFCCRRS